MERLQVIQASIDEAKGLMEDQKKQAERVYLKFINSYAQEIAEMKGFKIGEVASHNNTTILIDIIRISKSFCSTYLVLEGLTYTKKKVPAKSGGRDQIHISIEVKI